MTQQLPLEERDYAKKLGAMLAHASDCLDCRNAKCLRCGLVGFEHASADECIDASRASPQSSSEPVASGVVLLGQAMAPAERDLSDPRCKLCPRGEELRALCREAMSRTPAERLVAYWGLESADVPEDDRWDCSRGAEWVRSDVARARGLMEEVQRRKGCLLEDVDEEVSALRDAFLKGFRSVCPGPGRAPTAEELAARREAVERIVTMISERFVNRHRGVLPHPAAVEAFRRGHDSAVATTDLVALARGIESVRLRKGALWSQAAPRGVVPGDAAAQAEELRALALWAAQRHAQMEQEKG